MFRQIVALSRFTGCFKVTFSCNRNIVRKITFASQLMKRQHPDSTINHSRMATDVQHTNSGANVVIGTHDGIFHCDEVLACFMLQTLPRYANSTIVRSRDNDILSKCDIVVDVGSSFEPEKFRFDHHQKTFDHTLSSLKPEFGSRWTVRLSSAGLIYTFFGEEVIQQVLKNAQHDTVSADCLRNVFLKVYEYFIQEIDGIDNGVPQHPDEPLYRITTNLSSRVSNYNSVWNSKEDYDVTAQFERAKKLVGEEFVDKVLYYATVWWPARAVVEDAIRKRLEVHSSGEIIEISEMCPWKQHLYDLEKEHGIEGVPKYCLAASSPTDYRVIGVPITANSFLCRKFLPKEWRGVRDAALKNIAGIEDANFCHATGFIGGAKTRNGALAMAIRAVEIKSDE